MKKKKKKNSDKVNFLILDRFPLISLNISGPAIAQCTMQSDNYMPIEKLTKMKLFYARLKVRKYRSFVIVLDVTVLLLCWDFPFLSSLAHDFDNIKDFP